MSVNFCYSLVSAALGLQRCLRGEGQAGDKEGKKENIINNILESKKRNKLKSIRSKNTNKIKMNKIQLGKKKKRKEGAKMGGPPPQRGKVEGREKKTR